MSWYNPKPPDLPLRLPRQYPRKVIPSCIGKNGLVLDMLFHHGTGDIVKDYSPYGNHGTIHGARWIDGWWGWALEFDGVDDAVGLPYHSVFTSVGDFTVEALITPREPSAIAWRSIVAFGGAGDEFLFGFHFGKVAFFSNDLSPSYQEGVTTLSDNILYFIAFVRSGADYYIYLNGDIDKQGTWDSTTIVLDSGNRAIGRDEPTSGSEIYKGTIHFLRIYNRALSQREIRAHANYLL